MDLLKTILAAQGGGMVGQLAKNFGLNESQAGSAIGQLLPALSRGMQSNLQKPGGLESLLGALKKGQHGRYLDDPTQLNRPETVKDGNGILGHIFGNKATSREVASRAASNTGLDVGILKKMLPTIAAMAMGGMSKQRDGGLLSSLTAGSDGLPDRQAMGGLGKLLDSDGDGSIADDLFGLAKKFF